MGQDVRLALLFLPTAKNVRNYSAAGGEPGRFTGSLPACTRSNNVVPTDPAAQCETLAIKRYLALQRISQKGLCRINFRGPAIDR